MADELVTISKAGEPKLKILFAHLAAHVKLGWEQVEDEIEDLVEKIEGKKKADK